MARYLHLYRDIVRTFGWQARPLATFGLLQARKAISGATLALDRVVAPDATARPLDRPIFILGSPRSGTTFLHRQLVSSETTCGYALWEMLFPAVSARRLLGGLVDRMAPLNPARFHDPDAHDTGLRDVETDDALTLFNFVDGPFLWSYFHAWQDTWGSPDARRAFGLDEPPEVRQRLFDYLDACWRRSSYAHQGRRVVIKSSTFTMRAPQILERWPDARLLLVIRDPVDAIPSAMSMLENVIAKAYGVDRVAPEARVRWLENLYQASVDGFRKIHGEQQSGAIPASALHVVTYPDLMQRLEPTFDALMAFLELENRPAFRAQLRETAERQRQHKSRHAYDLARYGLTTERIHRDLAFVYDTYGLPRRP